MIDAVFSSFTSHRAGAHRRADYGLVGILATGAVEFAAAIGGYKLARSQTDSDLLGVVGGLLAAKVASDAMCDLACRYELSPKKTQVGAAAPAAEPAPPAPSEPAAPETAGAPAPPVAVFRKAVSEARQGPGFIVRGAR